MLKDITNTKMLLFLAPFPIHGRLAQRTRQHSLSISIILNHHNQESIATWYPSPFLAQGDQEGVIFPTFRQFLSLSLERTGTCRGEEKDFEKRFNLLSKEQLIRIRFLDASKSPLPNVTDISFTERELKHYNFTIDNYLLQRI